MQKQAQQPIKAKEEKGPLVQIKLGGAKGNGGIIGVEAGGTKKGGFKKGGFKSAFGSTEDEEPIEVNNDEEADPREVKAGTAKEEDSDFTDEEDYYDPRQPTGCVPGCKRWVRATLG